MNTSHPRFIKCYIFPNNSNRYQFYIIIIRDSVRKFQQFFRLFGEQTNIKQCVFFLLDFINSLSDSTMFAACGQYDGIDTKFWLSSFHSCTFRHSSLIPTNRPCIPMRQNNTAIREFVFPCCFSFIFRFLDEYRRYCINCPEIAEYNTCVYMPNAFVYANSVALLVSNIG